MYHGGFGYRIIVVSGGGEETLIISKLQETWVSFLSTEPFSVL